MNTKNWCLCWLLKPRPDSIAPYIYIFSKGCLLSWFFLNKIKSKLSIIYHVELCPPGAQHFIAGLSRFSRPIEMNKNQKKKKTGCNTLYIMCTRVMCLSTSRTHTQHTKEREKSFPAWPPAINCLDSQILYIRLSLNIYIFSLVYLKKKCLSFFLILLGRQIVGDMLSSALY